MTLLSLRLNAVRGYAAAITLFLILFYGGLARAEGLVATTGPDASELVQLTKLQVNAELNEKEARVTEVRSYVPAVFAQSLTFYRSLVGLSAVTELLVNGAPVSGVVLEPDEADRMRRLLAIALGDPAPLRDLGARLFFAELGPQTGNVEITLTTQTPLVPYGTLFGVALPIDWHRQPVGSMDLSVIASTEAPLRTLYAPNHDLVISRLSDFSLTGTFSRSNVYTDFDLVLLLSSGEEPLRLDVLPFRYSETESGFYLATLTARRTEQTAVEPREIAFAIDTSGSMSGEKITQAKAALSSVLQKLRPEDSFALVAFSDQVRSYAPNAVAATPENLSAALGFVDALAAAGGTNIYSAMDTAFAALGEPAGKPRYAVLLTDGQPTSGETRIDAIAELGRQRSASGRARIFSFGIGYDVNTVLLDKLARDSSGDALYIQPGADVYRAVTSFFEQIADPVLSGPVLDWSSLEASDAYPAVLQDLYANSPAVVVGRYVGGGAANVTLTGAQGGQTVTYSFDVTLPSYDFHAGNVPRLWALRRIGSLLEEIKLGAGGLEDEALSLATRYGVGTAFTFFQLDGNGDTRMVYSPVPRDAVGATAVGTSTLLDGYGKSATVTEAAPTADVRYRRDRVFPLEGGYYRDSSLGDRTDWVELRFGSDLYFAFAQAEAKYGAAELLSVGQNVEFELLGRAFRVTGTSDLLATTSALPVESDSVPAPAWTPESGPTSATPGPTTGGPQQRSSVTPPKSENVKLFAGCDCRASTAPPPRGFSWFWLFAVSLVAAARRSKGRNGSNSSLLMSKLDYGQLYADPAIPSHVGPEGARPKKNGVGRWSAPGWENDLRFGLARAQCGRKAPRLPELGRSEGASRAATW
ncbi:MAG TPA: VWA domain-containing protein [Polyangiaceae bacterium]